MNNGELFRLEVSLKVQPPCCTGCQRVLAALQCWVALGSLHSAALVQFHHLDPLAWLTILLIGPTVGVLISLVTISSHFLAVDVGVELFKPQFRAFTVHYCLNIGQHTFLNYVFFCWKQKIIILFCISKLSGNTTWKATDTLSQINELKKITQLNKF